jgi:HPt (histidine-containing phosphotransfer) domain-containing protein/HAMP domain-containing protein
MKTTLGKQIIILFFFPVAVLFIALTLWIHSTVSTYVRNWIQLEIRGLTQINAADLSGQINGVRVAVLTMAQILEEVDYSAEDSRGHVEHIIKSLFINDVIYNVWLIYEPQAFDGRDDYHTEDYPGAPSGRFMRSFNEISGEIVVAPDMEECWIDDMEYAYWYVIPRDTGRVYMDVDTEGANLWDYGLGNDPVYTLSIASPIFRDGEVIGVIGVDMRVDTMTISINGENEAASTVAVFYSSGRIFYSPCIELAEESIRTLGFESADAICAAFYSRETLSILEEMCPFSGLSSFLFFEPVQMEGYDDVLFLYVSLARSVYYERIVPILGFTIAASVCIIGFLTTMFTFAIRKVSRPINKLTIAANAIAQGNIGVAIDYSPDAQGEIGLLSQSLHTMVENFRLDAMKMEQQQLEASIKSRIEPFITSNEGKSEIFTGVAKMLCEYFEIYKTTIVYAEAGTVTAYPNDTHPYEFLHHDQMEELLLNRKIIFMNLQTIKHYNIEFIDLQTASLCIIPLRKDNLFGYIICESSVREVMFEGTELVLKYISEVLSEWLSQKEWDDSAVTLTLAVAESELYDHEYSEIISRLKRIDCMDVDSALERMGGLQDSYEKTVKLLARLMPETISKMDTYLANGDAKNFTIEVHGIKGVLKNIGAASLGNDAANLENASIENNADYIEKNYPPFKALLEEFLIRLNAALAQDETEATEKETIDKTALIAALNEAHESAESYDAVQAVEKLNPLLGFSYNNEADELIKQAVNSLEEFDCDGASAHITKILEII